MKELLLLATLIFSGLSASGQSDAQKIYETERSFEKMVAEKGINAGFVEYLAKDGVMFFPEAANGRETWKSRPASPAALTWNPILIDVSSNGVLAYSIGNSVYLPKGKDDTTSFPGHYISVWARQPSGEYRAVLDTGINHEKPPSTPTDWKTPTGSGQEKNEKRLSAADSSTGFYSMVAQVGAAKAFKAYLADDAILMRDGMQPYVGKKAATDFLGKQKPRMNFDKRKSFIEAVDLAYVYDLYTIIDKAGTEIEKGNFVQIWKLRNGKWQIVADVLVPITKASK